MPSGKPGTHLWNEWKYIATENGVSRQLFEARVWIYKTKWDPYTAASTPKQKAGRRPIVHTSKWDKWKHVALKNGVSKELFESRIWDRRPGWSEYKAANTPKQKAGRKGKVSL